MMLGISPRARVTLITLLLSAALISHATIVLNKGSKCEGKGYRNHVLKLVKETPFAGLFRDVKNQTKWEASGVAAVRGQFWVVFDSSMSLGLLDDSFAFRGKNNRLVGEWLKESQFEGIAYVPENDTFLLLHESFPSYQETNGPFKPSITTVKIHKDQESGYDILSQCAVDFELTAENKGFESIMYLHIKKGESFLLGLCEGNHCAGGKEGKDAGNGRIVVSQLDMDDKTGECLWTPVKTINVPSSANFRDYSGMAINHGIGKIAVLSQEDAAVWIGDFDVDAVDFASEEGTIYDLPRDNHCEMIYCNAEGIQWLDNYRFVIASDKAKSDQPFWCGEKDQSIHIFAMPPGWEPYVPMSEMSESGKERFKAGNGDAHLAV